MTRRSLFQGLAAAFFGSVLAKMPLAGHRDEEQYTINRFRCTIGDSVAVGWYLVPNDGVLHPPSVLEVARWMMPIRSTQ